MFLWRVEFSVCALNLWQLTCSQTTKSECLNSPSRVDYARLGEKKTPGNTKAFERFWVEKVEKRHQNKAGSEKLATKSANNATKIAISDSTVTPTHFYYVILRQIGSDFNRDFDGCIWFAGWNWNFFLTKRLKWIIIFLRHFVFLFHCNKFFCSR